MAIRAARSDPRCDGRVYGVGGSAGASHVLYMAATGTPGDDQLDLEVCLSGMYKFDDIEWLNDSCHPGDSCTPQLMENYLGLPAGSALLHLPELAAASPITYVTQAIPPVFILASDHDGAGADRYQFPDLIAKLESIGITESTDGTPQRQHYKRLLVQVITKQHAFAYWSRTDFTWKPCSGKGSDHSLSCCRPASLTREQSFKNDLKTGKRLVLTHNHTEQHLGKCRQNGSISSSSAFASSNIPSSM